MAVHWKVSFRSLRTNSLYTANIYDDSYSGSPVELIGADVPFETFEDDTEDMFVPVRTQSGYLRIVDDGTINWRSIIPATDTSRPVKLTNSNGDVLWQGFLQAQNFGSNLFVIPQQHDFPLQCSLTVTSVAQVDYLQHEMQNFAYLLEEIILSIPMVCRPSTIYVQGGSDAQAWLIKKIDWQNFVNVKKDDSIEANKNLYECLESMCRYWGWTARTYGENLYLTCVDDSTEPNFLRLSLENLHYLAVGITAGTNVGPLSSVTFGTNIYASENNTDYQERGPNKAVVTSDGNTADSEVVKAFPDSVLKTMYSGGTYTEYYSDTNIYGVFTNNIGTFDNWLMHGRCANDVSFNAVHLYETGGVSLSKTIADYSVIRVRPTYSEGVTRASLYTNYEHNFYAPPVSGFSAGGLFIYGEVIVKGQVYENANSHGVGQSTIHMRIGIGKTRNNALWYNYANGSWTSTMNEFTVRIGSTGEYKREMLGSCRTNDSRLQGYLFVDILGSDNMIHESGATGNVDHFDLANFRVEFRRSVNAGISSVFDTYERASSQEYDAFNGTMVDQEWSSSNIFATDKDMEFGYGVLSNPDGTPFTGHSYNGNTMEPEQHLANRVANYWASSKRRLSCELMVGSAPDLTPMNKGVIEGTMLYPISISRNWRDDVMTAMLMQI